MSPPVLARLGIIVFLILQSLAAVSYVRAVFTHPGRPPSWLGKDYIHHTVKDELQRIIERERRLGGARQRPAGGADGGGGADVGHDEVKHAAGEEGVSAGRGGSEGGGGGGGIQVEESSGSDTSASGLPADDAMHHEKRVSANAMLASALAQRRRHSGATSGDAGEEASRAGREGGGFRADRNNSDWVDEEDGGSVVQVPVVEASNEGDDDDLPADLPEQMAVRCELKRRRGLPLISVEQRASKALRLVSGNADAEGDVEARRKEMMFLLRGATLCRQCRVYSMHETVHCSVCDECVYWCDHHSVLIGQCVGWDNRKYALMTLCYTWAVSAWIVFMCWLALWNQSLVFDTLDDFGDFVSLVFFYVFWWFIITIPTARSVHSMLSGESSRIEEERLNRIEATRRARRRAPVNDQYEPLFESTLPEPPRLLRVSNMRRVFGEGPVGLSWLMITPPVRPSEESRQTVFTEQLRRMVEEQIRSTSDFSNETYEQQVFKEHVDGTDVIDATTTATGSDTHGAVEHAPARTNASTSVVDMRDLDAYNQPAEPVKRSRAL